MVLKRMVIMNIQWSGYKTGGVMDWINIWVIFLCHFLTTTIWSYYGISWSSHSHCTATQIIIAYQKCSANHPLHYNDKTIYEIFRVNE